jgi:hypothetical protein
MAEYSNPIEVGSAQVSTFFPYYSPVTGSIGTDPGGWSFRTGYVAPFRSFSQQLVNSTYNLGPYCRTTTGLSGRIIISTITGNLGFVQQCWYDFPRGPLDTDGNVKFEENYEWWNSCIKTRITVENLMENDNPPIVVEVAISNYGEGQPETIGIWPKVSLFFFRIVNLTAFAIFGGTCGVGAEDGYPQPDKNGGLFEDISGLINGTIGAIGNALGGGEGGPLGGILGGLGSGHTAGPGGPGGELESGGDLGNTLLGWLSDHATKFSNFMDSLSDYALSLASENEQTRNENLRQVAGLIGSVPQAADLFINGWLIPNLNLASNPNAIGSLNNPYLWRPPEADQQRYIGYFNTVMPLDNLNVPASTPTNQSTGQNDWGWFLTMLNRGSSLPPYVDPATNELAVPENYGFNRGGSISASTDDFLNSVESKFGKQTADSLGTLLDMSPASPVFIVTIVPITALETMARLIKVDRGESVNPVTNLDAYQTTYFEMRISANSVKEGNPTLYNNLVNAGLMQPVP